MRDRLNSQRCCEYLKALAEPDRLRIVQCLQQHGPLAVGDIAERLKSPMANVSHHLKQLRIAKLIAGRKSGRSVIYALAKGLLTTQENGAPDRLDLGCCRLELGPTVSRAKTSRADS